MKSYGHVDLQQNELRNAVIPVLTGYPLNPKPGQLAFINRVFSICGEILNGLPLWIPLTQQLDTHVHTQTEGAMEWTFNHSLNTATALVQVFDQNGQVVIPDSIDCSVFNSVTIRFANSQVGTAVVMLGNTSGGSRQQLAFEQQFVNSASWVCVHNLGYNPIVRVIVNGMDAQPDSIVYDSTTQCTVNFTSPQSGEVRCV